MIEIAGHAIVYPVFLAAACVAGLGITLLILAALPRYEIAFGLVLLSACLHFGSVPNIDMGSIELLLETVEVPGPAKMLRVGIIALAGAIGFLRYFRIRREAPEPIPPPFLLLAAFLLLATLSVAYSIEPRFTLVRTAEFIAFYGFLLGMYSWVRSQREIDLSLNIFFCFLVFAVIMNAAAIGLFPGKVWHWRAPDRYQGLMGHPNSLGEMCTMTYLVFLWKFRRLGLEGRVAVAALTLVALGMHVISGSRGPLAAAIAGFFFWSYFMRDRAKMTAIATAVIAAGIILTAAPSLLPSFQRGAEGDKKTSGVRDLTGRTEMWAPAIQLLARRPLTGYGYEVSGSIWDDPKLTHGLYISQWGSSKTSLHNGYLDIAIGMGLTGLALWLLILLWPLRRMFQMPVSETKALLLAFMLQFLVINIAESAISTSRSFASLGFWLMWCMALRAPECLPILQRHPPTDEPVDTALCNVRTQA